MAVLSTLLSKGLGTVVTQVNMVNMVNRHGPQLHVKWWFLTWVLGIFGPGLYDHTQHGQQTFGNLL